jgi:hypothetical protein
MRILTSLVLAAGLALSHIAVAGAQDRTETVHFPRGATGTVITGRLGSEQGIRYVLGASNGQFLRVSLRPDNPNTYFIIYVPGGDILYESSQAGNEYYGQLYKSGDHVVQVFYKGEPGTYGNYDVAFDISAGGSAQAPGRPQPLQSGGGIPLLNAQCGNGVEVHADQGGPVFVNGNEASLKKFNDNYYEASYGDVTISLSINPDGSPNLTATWRGGGNGVCQLMQY